MSSAESTREVPVEACRFDMSRVQFMDGEGQDGRVTLTARSGDAIDHWYWGRIVHDLEGLAHADSCPLDFCHNEYEAIGFLDTFDTESGDLVVGGALTPFKEDDLAAEILHKGRAGVPYQASIFYDPRNGLRLEEVMAGVSVEVNGRQFEGPLIVVRQWLLRGVAVCLYGADPHTKSQFRGRGDKPGETVEITIFQNRGSEMSTEKGKPAPDSASKNDQPAEDPAKFRAEFNAELSKFCEKFGAENGTKWLTEGLSYADALEKHCSLQAEQLAAGEKSREELQEKLTSLKGGEREPLDTGQPSGDTEKKKTGFRQFIRIRDQEPAGQAHA